MRKHTTIDIDVDLLQRAAEVLGTTRTIDTIHGALTEVVRRRLRASLFEIDTDLDLAALNEVRAHRFAERPTPHEVVDEG
jgi:Arc/MetJ family transcription regulator